MNATQTVSSADGTAIAYETAGSGPALILVDAASCYRGMGPMAELAGHLTDHFTVTRYDRRGRGESGDTEPYAVEREIEDLAALVDASGGSVYVHGFSSGAVLSLYAAASGVPIEKLAVLEPPLRTDTEPPAEQKEFVDMLSGMIAEGRRGDAIAYFQESCGVPEEMRIGMRQSPLWPDLEALAHTLVYDSLITSAFPMARLAKVPVATLVLDSSGSDERLQDWARAAADTLPHGTHQRLTGEWHGVPAETLAAALRQFFTAA